MSATEDVGPDLSLWAGLQERLRRRLVARVDATTRRADGTRRTLVVLVHGFNNSDSGAVQMFELFRQPIRALATDAVFLEIYWDGLVAASPPVFIWGEAQANFPLVGIEFRRVLNSIDKSTPVRILTHSSGGPLIASTLGDASAPYADAKGPEMNAYRYLVKGDEPGYNRNFPEGLRVGMIVPAGGNNTFQNFKPDSTGLSRLIIGVNRRDYAVGKSVIWNCGWSGATCLGVRRSAFCNNVEKTFVPTTGVRPYLYDFTTSQEGILRKVVHWSDHSVSSYLRREKMREFLDALFGDKTPVGFYSCSS